MQRPVRTDTAQDRAKLGSLTGRRPGALPAKEPTLAVRPERSQLAARPDVSRGAG